MIVSMIELDANDGDRWCWYHDREVHHQPMIDNNILVLIANKLSEYVENQPGGGGE